MEILKLANVRCGGKVGMQTYLGSGFKDLTPLRARGSYGSSLGLTSSPSSSPHSDGRTEAGQIAGHGARYCQVQ